MAFIVCECGTCDVHLLNWQPYFSWGLLFVNDQVAVAIDGQSVPHVVDIDSKG